MTSFLPTRGCDLIPARYTEDAAFEPILNSTIQLLPHAQAIVRYFTTILSELTGIDYKNQIWLHRDSSVTDTLSAFSLDAYLMIRVATLLVTPANSAVGEFLHSLAHQLNAIFKVYALKEHSASNVFHLITNPAMGGDIVRPCGIVYVLPVTPNLDFVLEEGEKMLQRVIGEYRVTVIYSERVSQATMNLSELTPISSFGVVSKHKPVTPQPIPQSKPVTPQSKPVTPQSKPVTPQSKPVVASSDSGTKLTESSLIKPLSNKPIVVLNQRDEPVYQGPKLTSGFDKEGHLDPQRLIRYVESLLGLFYQPELVKIYTHPEYHQLWKQCFSHFSYNPVTNYETLETLGDSIIKTSFMTYLLNRNPDFSSSQLNDLQTAYMSERFQSRLGAGLRLSQHCFVLRDFKISPKVNEDLSEALLGVIYKISELESFKIGVSSERCVRAFFEHIFAGIEFPVYHLAGKPPKSFLEQLGESCGWGKKSYESKIIENGKELRCEISWGRNAQNYIASRRKAPTPEVRQLLIDSGAEGVIATGTSYSRSTAEYEAFLNFVIKYSTHSRVKQWYQETMFDALCRKIIGKDGNPPASELFIGGSDDNGQRFTAQRSLIRIRNRLVELGYDGNELEYKQTKSYESESCLCRLLVPRGNRVVTVYNRMRSEAKPIFATFQDFWSIMMTSGKSDDKPCSKDISEHNLNMSMEISQQ